jgi:hypothetical protein
MTHETIINLWPSLSVFADDIGVSYGTAKAMRRRGSIPPQYWPRMIAKAVERGIKPVSFEIVSKAAKPRKVAA